MTCPDCAGAADFAQAERDGTQLVTRSAADYFDAGHDRCAARNFGRPSPDCSCQHRPVRVVSGG